jgi:hypothetical protein
MSFDSSLNGGDFLLLARVSDAQRRTRPAPAKPHLGQQSAKGRGVHFESELAAQHLGQQLRAPSTAQISHRPRRLAQHRHQRLDQCRCHRTFPTTAAQAEQPVQSLRRIPAHPSVNRRTGCRQRLADAAYRVPVHELQYPQGATDLIRIAGFSCHCHHTHARVSFVGGSGLVSSSRSTLDARVPLS